MILGREPAVIAAAIESILLLVMAFGFDIDNTQMAAIMVAVNAVLALFVRQNVTPTVKLQKTT